MKAIIQFSLVFSLSVFAASARVHAADVSVGDAAPHFAVKDDQGETWDSRKHFGEKIVVLYFYPADMTGGCTKQACSFRDDLPQLSEKGVEVIGVSGDSVENHQLFKQAHDLNFTLLADTEGEIAKAYGVPLRTGGSIQRTVNDKEFTLTRGVTAARWTFVVGKDGKVVHKDTSVNAAKDSEKVMEVVKKLQK